MTSVDGDGMRCPRVAARHRHSRAASGIMSVSITTDVRGAPLEVGAVPAAKPPRTGKASTKPGPMQSLLDERVLKARAVVERRQASALQNSASRNESCGGYGSASFGVPLPLFAVRHCEFFVCHAPRRRSIQ